MYIQNWSLFKAINSNGSSEWKHESDVWNKKYCFYFVLLTFDIHVMISIATIVNYMKLSFWLATLLHGPLKMCVFHSLIFVSWTGHVSRASMFSSRPPKTSPQQCYCSIRIVTCMWYCYCSIYYSSNINEWKCPMNPWYGNWSLSLH